MSVRICHRSTRWLRHSVSASRAASRCLASTASATHSHNDPSAVPPELTHPSPTTNAEDPRMHDSVALVPASSTPQSSLASYRVSAGNGLRLPEHKIHVLGTDERSRFIAHALSGVYDHVELLGRNPRGRGYTNIETKGSRVVANTVFGTPDDPAEISTKDPRRDGSPIEKLIVTGTGTSAVEAIESVKDRINEDTNICLMNDGLGVLEEVTESVLKDVEPKSRPAFLLGHMNHKLRFNRSTKAVKQIKPGRTMLTEIDPWAEKLEAARPDLQLPSTSISSNFIAMMQKSEELKVDPSPYDRWLQFKLPAVVFQAVVEPVCVLLDVPYNSLLANYSARRFMDTMITEIEGVVSRFPEMQGSPELQEFLCSGATKRICYSMISAKKDNPSELVRLVKKGLETDVNYQNGYFLRRAKKLGLELPMNKLMTQMVLAKSAETQAKLAAYVPIEEASVDSRQ